jgi:hypothetical protein
VAGKLSRSFRLLLIEVKIVDDIVRRAADPGSDPEARHEAFGELVIRFQDMAFACAFAVLGDACLAQDTAQEASNSRS